MFAKKALPLIKILRCFMGADVTLSLNCATVRLLREELQLLQEPGSYVGEVVKLMGKTKVLVKVRVPSPTACTIPCPLQVHHLIISCDMYATGAP